MRHPSPSLSDYWHHRLVVEKSVPSVGCGIKVTSPPPVPLRMRIYLSLELVHVSDLRPYVAAPGGVVHRLQHIVENLRTAGYVVALGRRGVWENVLDMAW